MTEKRDEDRLPDFPPPEDEKPQPPPRRIVRENGVPSMDDL
jgi:hypothetical protein